MRTSEEEGGHFLAQGTFWLKLLGAASSFELRVEKKNTTTKNNSVSIPLVKQWFLTFLVTLPFWHFDNVEIISPKNFLVGMILFFYDISFEMAPPYED